MKYSIIAADRVIDGKGDHSQTEKLLSRARRLDLRTTELEIVSLAKRWEDKLGPQQFKSGASAMAALERAKKLLQLKKTNLVVIRGKDLLRSGYAPGEREKYMQLYGRKHTPLEGYTKLVKPFLKEQRATEKEFFSARNALFENYTRTWKRLNPQKDLPAARWFEPLTKYFRGVDCANPNIDYSGQLLVADEATANLLKVPQKQRILILGNAFTKLPVDGYDSIPKIVPYKHLERTLNMALKEAGVNFQSEYLKGRGLLEAYTCYPVVPMALLLKLGLVESISEIPEFLESHEVTITGGLNLDRAAWNLTSLNYLIAMREKLLASKAIRFGLVHGNGSLGNQQGITVLGKTTSERSITTM